MTGSQPENGTAHSTYVNSNDAVCHLADLVAAAERVAVDTEADSLHHYFHKVCLIQVSVAGRNFIIDPLAGADLGPLIEALAVPLLIFHDADYDMRMLRRDFGFRPSGIFDTMIAARLLGYGQFGLGALVSRHFGIDLVKNAQRADWSRRPLSASLIQYATDDTRYLDKLTLILGDELAERGRLAWHDELCRALIEHIGNLEPEPPDPDREWRIKGWNTVETPRGLAVLRELWKWRDAEAQRVDLPPFRIMPNDMMVRVARWVENGSDPNARPKLPRNCVGRRHNMLRQAVTRANGCPEDQLPTFTLRGRRSGLASPDESVVRRVQDYRNRLAHELGVEPGFLLSSGTIETIIRHSPRTPEDVAAGGGLLKWQAELMAAEILRLISAPPGPKSHRSAEKRNTTSA